MYFTKEINNATLSSSKEKRNGGFEYDSITLGTDTEWRHVWVLLDSQDEDGLPITYDVVAAAPIG